jgi:hypothetical protein
MPELPPITTTVCPASSGSLWPETGVVTLVMVPPAGCSSGQARSLSGHRPGWRRHVRYLLPAVRVPGGQQAVDGAWRSRVRATRRRSRPQTSRSPSGSVGGGAGRRGAAAGGSARRAGQAAAVRGDRLLEVFAQVVPQVPAVGHLDRVWCAVPGALGVGPGPVPADSRGTRRAREDTRGRLFNPARQIRVRALRSE